jgi:hypothetical protein
MAGVTRLRLIFGVGFVLDLLFGILGVYVGYPLLSFERSKGSGTRENQSASSLFRSRFTASFSRKGFAT